MFEFVFANYDTVTRETVIRVRDKSKQQHIIVLPSGESSGRLGIALTREINKLFRAVEKEFVPSGEISVPETENQV